jgi:hypothetical protein
MTRNASPGGNQAIIEVYGAGKKITRVYWSSNYNILTGPGATVSSVVTGPVSGQWYHIELGINLDNGTINAWADGVQEIFAAPFYQSSGQIDTVTLTGYSYATAYSYVDNLQGRRIDLSAGPADFDEDGDVDQQDFDLFLPCVTGANQGPPATGCTNEDLDADSDVDSADFGRFQRCLSGESVQPDPNCAN